MAVQHEVTGYLTVYSLGRSEVYGEFADGVMRVEETSGGKNYIFSGSAGEGTLDTFIRVNNQGIEHVEFEFDAAAVHSGTGRLLALEHEDAPASARVHIEWVNPPGSE